ncbi:GNAT family N-acetyltransferase [Metabacillus idriensis]|uniref:GNAT family N-acetyltransferase n=1 Tax=Metabacillus idriensis TaxID=324768 RepID=A0A6I2MA32_9BACI|nr:GNAT family N-acetyltransferase [Metabacillus idriensis]MCM3598391.1 GNAT family N-acetyltransferase [Metabacillus idriensis]MRX54988.1 GNAT family N-acetyltransferase [Metabacillus idriensis]OHR71536.1 GCN5 family acetyltransferase [Bacillus sp. HMSC76G11]
MEWQKNEYHVSDDQTLLQIEKIEAWISESYWAKGRSRKVIEESIKHSLSFGLYDQNGRQIGFARVITDQAVFSWIMDVIIDEEYRGRGLGKFLVECIISHPTIKNTKMGLATKDAHNLYRQFGFETEEYMRRPLI